MLIVVKLMPTHHQWVQPQPNNMLKQNIDYFKPQGNVATAYMNRFFKTLSQWIKANPYYQIKFMIISI